MAARPRKSGPRKGQAAPGLSIVVPLYNEATGLAHLHGRIVEAAERLKAARGLSVEVVYVDDGSRDATGEIAAALPADGLDIQLITLSRNFGKESALLAGLDHARLGAVLFMDGDGQHSPELIDTLVSRWLDDDYDVVFTAKAHRENESMLRRVGVHWFYVLLNWRAKQKIPEDAGDFRLLSPRAAAALRQMPERNRFFKGLSSWIGFRQVRVDYEPALRAHGATTWNVWSLIGLSIEGLTSFSVAPLRIASMLGMLLAVMALIFGFQILFETWVYGKDVPGYPSLFVGMMVLGAVQLIMIGVLGEYIGKLLSEAKARPVYFIAEHSVKQARGSAQASTKEPGEKPKPRLAAPRAAE
ncbi:MAG: glycosyltransferase family 2 protein [Pseudolabrys sp.]